MVLFHTAAIVNRAGIISVYLNQKYFVKKSKYTSFGQIEKNMKTRGWHFMVMLGRSQDGAFVWETYPYFWPSAVFPNTNLYNKLRA